MTTLNPNPLSNEGILLVDKPKGVTSFKIVQILRRLLGVKKIGHAGTLDPFATGLLVMLVGRSYTRLSDSFLCEDKEYIAEAYLGVSTDTYDVEGKISGKSSLIPSLEDIEQALQLFQGEIEQTPPMYSAKKQGGKKLYELARKGIEVERKPVKVRLHTYLIRYEYPYLELRIVCSKGTYIRSLAHDLGIELKCGAHLTNLRRIRSGHFHLRDSLGETELNSPCFNFRDRLIHE